MKMPTLLEHIGVGPKLENKHSVELPFSMQMERKKLKRGIWRTGSFALLALLGKKHRATENVSFYWVRSASQLVSDITVISCFLFVMFSTQKLIHRMRSNNSEQNSLGHQWVQCSLQWGGRCFSLCYHLSAACLVGIGRKVGGDLSWRIRECSQCYGRCYTCSLNVTCYWIPSSSPPLQIAAGDHVGGIWPPKDIWEV